MNVEPTEATALPLGGGATNVQTEGRVVAR